MVLKRIFGPRRDEITGDWRRLLNEELNVLYGCETWSLTLWEERKLRVFENMVLRRIFGPRRDEVKGEWRRLHIRSSPFFSSTFQNFPKCPFFRPIHNYAPNVHFTGFFLIF